MPEMDYTALLELIKSKKLNQKEVAKKIGVSEGQFCHKLAGRFPFKQSEISKICEVLEISEVEIGKYFFAQKVEKTQ